MTSIQQNYEQSGLAQAAYSNVYSGMPNSVFVSELINNSEMTTDQATKFAATYTVIDRKFDSTGLSVTLFEEIQSNADGSKDQHVAIRGTQDGMDILTDIIFIGLVGRESGDSLPI